MLILNPCYQCHKKTPCQVLTSNLTLKTRQRKTRLAEDHSSFVQNWDLVNKTDIVDIVLLSLKNLDLREELNTALLRKDNIGKNLGGRRMTPYATRKLVWDFLQNNATPSTITS